MRQRLEGRRRLRHDSGETLIELIVTIVIMSTAVVAIVGATATSIHLSDIHRKQAKAGNYVRAYAEALESAVAAPSTGYTQCAQGSDYGTNIYPVPEAGYQPSATDVRFWNGSGWSSSFPNCPDPGVQRVTLQVQYNNAGQLVTESLAVIIRRPCRPGDTESQCA